MPTGGTRHSKSQGKLPQSKCKVKRLKGITLPSCRTTRTTQTPPCTSLGFVSTALKTPSPGNSEGGHLPPAHNRCIHFPLEYRKLREPNIPRWHQTAKTGVIRWNAWVSIVPQDIKKTLVLMWGNVTIVCRMIPIQAQTTCLWTLLSLEYPWRQHLAFLLVPLKKKKSSRQGLGHELRVPCFARSGSGGRARVCLWSGLQETVDPPYLRMISCPEGGTGFNFSWSINRVPLFPPTPTPTKPHPAFRLAFCCHRDFAFFPQKTASGTSLQL